MLIKKYQRKSQKYRFIKSKHIEEKTGEISDKYQQKNSDNLLDNKYLDQLEECNKTNGDMTDVPVNAMDTRE